MGFGIYSSGSFKHRIDIWLLHCWGLTKYIDDHFDLGMGYKHRTDSYQKRLPWICWDSNFVLLDSETELDSAEAAGMKTLWLFRMNKNKQNTNGLMIFQVFKSFLVRAYPNNGTD